MIASDIELSSSKRIKISASPTDINDMSLSTNKTSNVNINDSNSQAKLYQTLCNNLKMRQYTDFFKSIPNATTDQISSKLYQSLPGLSASENLNRFGDMAFMNSDEGMLRNYLNALFLFQSNGINFNEKCLIFLTKFFKTIFSSTRTKAD